ncbi:MAG: hypothetical protein JNL08_17495 [Planctomycetes bacterium]|nr:hypothetical protein [Planctomycetota bacterium]
MSHGKHSDEHYGEPGARHQAVALDPEHDINAKSATLWVVGGAIVTFVCLWVMVPIFLRVQQEERARKVEQTENVEYNEVKAHERAFLGGQNPTKRSIADVLKQLAGN